MVDFLSASIGNNLDCDSGEFENPDDYALIGDGLTTNGSVFLREVKARGGINLLSAKIGTNLECDNADFENPDGYALLGANFIVNGSVFLRNGFKAKGEVNIVLANIGSSLECFAGKFENPDGYAINGASLTTKGSFIWRELIGKPIGIVSLENAILSNIVDDKESWPEPGNLSIDGLKYDPFSSDVPANAESRLVWLNLRPPDDMSVQPYEQLISVFRQMGLEDDAREIAITKQKFIRKNLQGISRLWSWILDVTISYGYRPEKVIAWFIVPMIILGYFVFNWANSTGVMEFVGNQDIINPIFNPFVYSLDVFLPIVDLHHESAWSPISTAEFGKFVQSFIYFQILAGWLFTTLAVAAVTGLVRRD
jgi:hypothetical protein